MMELPRPARRAHRFLVRNRWFLVALLASAVFLYFAFAVMSRGSA